MVLEKAGGPELRISGYITTRQSCDGEEPRGWALWVRITRRHNTCAKKEAKIDMGAFLGIWVWASLLPPVLSPAVLQSVLCGADALIPVQTGAAGSASFRLLGNGSLIYQVRVSSCRLQGGQQGRALTCRGKGPRSWLAIQLPSPNPAHQVQVVGTGSEVVAMTLESKPQRKSQRTVLCHMAGLQLGGHMVRVPGRVVPGLPIHGLREARLVE